MLRKLVIVAHGDNDALHEEALKAAVRAVENVNKAPVYRAWGETVEYEPQPERRAEVTFRLTATDLLTERLRRDAIRVGRMLREAR